MSSPRCDDLRDSHTPLFPCDPFLQPLLQQGHTQQTWVWWSGRRSGGTTQVSSRVRESLTGTISKTSDSSSQYGNPSEWSAAKKDQKKKKTTTICFTLQNIKIPNASKPFLPPP